MNLQRKTLYGSPFKNLDAGRYEMRDCENTQRIKRAMRNYLASEGNPHNGTTFNTSRGQRRRQVVQVTLRVAQHGPRYDGGRPAHRCHGISCVLYGTQIGKFLADAFLSPTARYAPKFMMLLGAFQGYRIYTDVCSWYATNFVLMNYARFPTEIQDALRTHDSRYARKWLA